jgi:hypothetical protein
MPCYDRGQRRLAGHQWLAAQVLAVKLNQVERAEDNPVVVMMVSKALEVRDADVVAGDRLAVDDDRAKAQSRQSFDDEWKPPRQVIARSAVKTNPMAILAGDHPEPIVLDLVKPQRARRRLGALGRQAGCDEPRRV